MKRLRTNCFCHAGTELASAPFYAAVPLFDGRKLRGSAYCQYLLLSVIVHTYRWSVKINDAHKCAHIVNEKGVNDRLRIDFVLTSFFKTIRYCKTIVLRKQNVMLFLTATVAYNLCGLAEFQVSTIKPIPKIESVLVRMVCPTRTIRCSPIRILSTASS